MIQKFSISRDDRLYHAWPDVALTPGGKLVCVFSECTHHGDRSYTRVMVCDSDDRGRTWSPKRPITEALHCKPPQGPWWNCARITALRDGRLVVVVDRINGSGEGAGGEQSNWLFFSDDAGRNWSAPVATPIVGIVPDQVIELRSGRWLLGAHTRIATPCGEFWSQRCWRSDDQGQTWRGPHQIALSDQLKLCEGSILELPGGELVCFMRENSGKGLNAYKALSSDGGASWGPLTQFPLPGCHRPVAGMLRSGKVMITHRFMQGGQGWVGWWTQNVFAALTDVESCLADQRDKAHTRILPLDFDRSVHSDTGYTGWVQFDDGEIYIVNYILDDAPKGQIRGYSLREEDFWIG